MATRIDIPSPFREIFNPHRYKVFYGGRGCIDGNTKIYTPAGKIKVKDFSGGMVYVCDGASVRVAFAGAPKKYEAEDLYKISTASYSITVTAKHKFLTDRGWVNACDLQIDQDRLACVSPRASLTSFFPFQTIVDNALSAFLQDVGHCLRIIQGWICRYWLDFRPDGEQPRLLSCIDLNVFPLQDDVLQHKSHISSQKDDPERAYIDALVCQILSHLENLPALQGEAGKSFAGQENYIFGRFFELFSALHEALMQFHKYSNPASITHKYAELVQAFYTRASQDGTLEKVPVLRQFFSLDSSFSSSFVGCNLAPHIITQEFVKSITFVEKKEFYDLQIPFYENYIANGFINHNSGKSWNVARALLIKSMTAKIKVLCAREIQRSINDSVYSLLRREIEEMKIDQFFVITRDSIKCISGAEFIFKGLRTNPQEIKSTEGVDIAWVEEAQAVSAESWDVLIPTIRKPNSEIWLTFNPLDESDPTYQRFVLNAPEDALVRKVNYDENPYFPEVLRREMEWLKARDYESYLHIWEGEVRKHSNAVIFAGRFRVEEFDTPKDARFYHGADWGFACLVGDTVVPTDKGEKLLKDIKAGDKVLTREGYKTVIHSQSRGIKRVYAIDCGYKNAIIATEDHKIFTADGWRQVKDLRGTEKLCMMKSSLMARFIRGILTASTQIITTGNMGENVNMRYFTELYGNSIMGKSLMVATFTILTAIRLITALKTSCVSLKASIKKFTTKINSAVFQRKKCRSIENFMDIQNKTGKNAERRHSKRRKNDAGFALNVESHLPLQTCIKNSVHQIAENTKTQGTVKKNTLANVAEKFLLHLLTVLERPALKSVPINLQSRGEKEVFDITVENGEYFANGVLVHNCDPTVLVRCYLKDRTIFIDREAWGVGVDLDETPALFDMIETARSWPIKADNARPETISFMKRRGFHISGAKKWAGSIEDGIEYLKSLDIVIHPRCRHTIDEFNHYSYKIDKQTGDVLPVVVDAWNHCIDALRYSQDGLIKGRGQMQINPAALMMR